MLTSKPHLLRMSVRSGWPSCPCYRVQGIYLVTCWTYHYGLAHTALVKQLVSINILFIVFAVINIVSSW